MLTLHRSPAQWASSGELAKTESRSAKFKDPVYNRLYISLKSITASAIRNLIFHIRCFSMVDVTCQAHQAENVPHTGNDISKSP